MLYTINYEEVTKSQMNVAKRNLGKLENYYEDGVFHVNEYECGSELTYSENSIELIN